MQTNEGYDSLWTDRDVAKYLNRSIHALRHDRLTKSGPPFIRVMGSVRYRKADIDRWIEQNIVQAG